MNIFRKIKVTLQLREAVRKANDAHQKTGNRYYVLPTFNGSGKLIVLDKKDFKKLRRKGYINTKASIRDLINESFYFTPYVNGDGYLSEHDRKRKVLQFFSWVEADRKANKERKRNSKKKK